MRDFIDLLKSHNEAMELIRSLREDKRIYEEGHRFQDASIGEKDAEILESKSLVA